MIPACAAPLDVLRPQTVRGLSGLCSWSHVWSRGYVGRASLGLSEGLLHLRQNL